MSEIIWCPRCEHNADEHGETGDDHCRKCAEAWWQGRLQERYVCWNPRPWIIDYYARQSEW